MANSLSDRTERTVSIQDSEHLLAQVLHFCTVLFSALAHPSAFFVGNLSNRADGFVASRAIASGIDRSVRSVSIPVGICEPLDGLFGMATGEPLSVLLSAGSLAAPWTDQPGDGLRVAVFTSAPPTHRTDLITGEVTTVAAAGPDQFTLCGWIPEDLIDLPVGGGIEGILGAARGLISEARNAVGIEYIPNATADEMDEATAARIAADLGR